MRKKHTFKKMISMMLVIGTLFCASTYSFAVAAQAAPPREVSPQWNSILSIDLDIAFEGNEATAVGIASKMSSATSIEGTVSVYKLVGDDWVFIDSAYNSKSRGTLGISVDFECKSGVTYKVVFDVTAYTGTVPESVSFEYSEKCP